MERSKMIAEIKQLFAYHKMSTTLDHEYSGEIYDFLVAEGILVLTPERKLAIFADAKRVYMTELTMQFQTAFLTESLAAQETLKRLKLDKLTKDEKDHLTSICKRISLKQYFDTITNIEL